MGAVGPTAKNYYIYIYGGYINNSYY